MEQFYIFFSCNCFVAASKVRLVIAVEFQYDIFLSLTFDPLSNIFIRSMKYNQEEAEIRHSSPVSYFQSYLLQTHPSTFISLLTPSSIDEEDHLLFFNALFSPKETAQSLQKKNENLQMINFDNSDSEPDQIYNKRKQKVSKLKTKEQTQLEELEELKSSDFPKYLSILNFMKFFYEIKKKVKGIRTDYYSTKTFYALKNSIESDLKSMTNVSKRMFEAVFKMPRIYGESSQNGSIDGRILEFLIIPRFLISKEKLSKLSKDMQLQQNFIFLVQHECLGHYNNEANKKMPEERQMKLIKELMKKNNGRERFKKICSINHGNKFLKNHGNLYFELYKKSLEYLKVLDAQLKKGKKYNFIIKEQLNKLPVETMESQEIQESHSSSSHHPLSFRGWSKELNELQSENSIKIDDEEEVELEDEVKVKEYEGIKVKKFQSTPINGMDIQRGFKVKKSLTLDSKPIVLIQPPKERTNQA